MPLYTKTFEVYHEQPANHLFGSRMTECLPHANVWVVKRWKSGRKHDLSQRGHCLVLFFFFERSWFLFLRTKMVDGQWLANGQNHCHSKSHYLSFFQVIITLWRLVCFFFKVLDFLLLKGRLTYSFTNIFITGVQFGFAADVLIAIGGTKGEIYERKMYRAAASFIAKTSSKGVRLITYTSILFNSREKTVGGNQKYSAAAVRRKEN